MLYYLSKLRTFELVVRGFNKVEISTEADAVAFRGGKNKKLSWGWVCLIASTKSVHIDHSFRYRSLLKQNYEIWKYFVYFSFSPTVLTPSLNGFSSQLIGRTKEWQIVPDMFAAELVQLPWRKRDQHTSINNWIYLSICLFPVLHSDIFCFDDLEAVIRQKTGTNQIPAF